ncbi:PREDICTED: protein fuzzy homolog isoform X2 [Polistes canadensis]|uniref:protein fuzzy homolog isoform X2 n=1 Tax=Polistes canadensis TaxID=91411 RepID=UPI000718EB22|nr:PREDICTED: protein fuzzy homolog isoform X2 [Polistes canadensis]
MAAQVMCLTSSGGIPLFSRQKGDKEMITFSKMASLNGVHMFLKTQNMKLLNTDLPDTAIVWKEYEQNSMYGCVLVHGCLAVATNGWWSLDPIERKLLIMTIATETNYTARDLPIFLPYKSPNIAFRLVSITLINHVEVVSLCGPNPELSEIERYAVQCWKTSMDILRNSEQCYLRNVPAALSLDINALGFLLANCKVDKFVLSRNAQSTKNRVTGTHRLDILRTFYHQAIEIFMLSSECEEGNIEMNLESKWKFVGAKETYLCSEYHKCHALKYEDHILCVLYASVVPTHTMRLITEKILKVLLIDKQICW